MPHISVKMYPGRTEEQKIRFAEKLVALARAELGCGEGSLSIAIEEVPEGEWMSRVYDRDIRESVDRLYKRPGYGPLAD